MVPPYHYSSRRHSPPRSRSRSSHRSDYPSPQRKRSHWGADDQYQDLPPSRRQRCLSPNREPPSHPQFRNSLGLRPLPIRFASISRGAGFSASCGKDPHVRLWRVSPRANEPLELHQSLRHGCSVFQAYVSEHGTCAVTSAEDGRVRIWDYCDTKPLVVEIERRKFRRARACQVSADGSYVVATFYRGLRTTDTSLGNGVYMSSFTSTLVLLDRDRRCVFELEESGKVDSCKMSLDASVIAVGLSGVHRRPRMATGNSIIVYNKRGTELGRFPDCMREELVCNNWDMSPDGRDIVLVSSGARSIELYEGGQWNKSPKILSSSDVSSYGNVRFAAGSTLVIAVTCNSYYPGTIRIFSTQSLTVLCESRQSIRGSVLALDYVMKEMPSKCYDCLEVRLVTKPSNPNEAPAMISSQFNIRRPHRPIPASYNHERPITTLELEMRDRLPAQNVRHPEAKISKKLVSAKRTPNTRGESLENERRSAVRQPIGGKEKDLGLLLERGRRERKSNSMTPQRVVHPAASVGAHLRKEDRKEDTHRVPRRTDSNSKTQLQDFLRKPLQSPPAKIVPERVKPNLETKHLDMQGDTSKVIGNKSSTDISMGKGAKVGPTMDTGRGLSLSLPAGHEGSTKVKRLVQVSRELESGNHELGRKSTGRDLEQTTENEHSGKLTHESRKNLATHGGLEDKLPKRVVKKQVEEQDDTASHQINREFCALRTAPDGIEKLLSRQDPEEDELKEFSKESSVPVVAEVANAKPATVTEPKGADQCEPLTQKPVPTAKQKPSITPGRREANGLQETSKETSAAIVPDLTDATVAIAAEAEQAGLDGSLMDPEPKDHSNSKRSSDCEEASNISVPSRPHELGGTTHTQSLLQSAPEADNSVSCEKDSVASYLVPARRIVFTSSKRASRASPRILPSPNEVEIAELSVPMKESTDGDESADDNVPIALLKRKGISNRQRRLHGRKMRNSPTAAVEKSASESPAVITERNEGQVRKELEAQRSQSAAHSCRAESILEYQPPRTTEKAIDAIVASGTSPSLSPAPFVHQARGNMEGRLHQRTESTGLVRYAQRQLVSAVSSPTSPETDVRQLSNEVPEAMLQNSQFYTTSVRDEAGEQLLLVGTSLLSTTSKLPSIADPRYRDVEEECIDEGFAGNQDALRRVKVREEPVTPEVASHLHGQPAMPCASGKGDIFDGQVTQGNTTLVRTAVKVEEKTVDSTSIEYRNKLVLVQERARNAFRKSSDRETQSGIRCVTGTKAFQIMVDVMENEIGCKEYFNKRAVAQAVYRKTGPGNICTEDMFVQAFSDLLEVAIAQRRNELEELFSKSLPEGEDKLLVFHARDLLKKDSDTCGMFSSDWTDEEMDGLLEKEGFGMVIDKDAFVRAAERTFCECRRKGILTSELEGPSF